MAVSIHLTHFIDLTWNSHTNPYNLAIVNPDPLNDYTSTPEQEVGVLSLGWGVLFYLFIYLFIYSYKYYILLYIFYITTSYIRLQLIYIQFEKKIHTVEPSFNKPLYNKVLSITNYFLQPSQNYSKMFGTEPRFNKPRFNEIHSEWWGDSRKPCSRGSPWFGHNGLK